MSSSASYSYIFKFIVIGDSKLAPSAAWSGANARLRRCRHPAPGPVPHGVSVVMDHGGGT